MPSVTANDSNTPLWAVDRPGTVAPVTDERLTEIVALPSTTSAMLRPTLPPILKVGEAEVRFTWAADNPDWVQSSPLPGVCEERFIWKTRPVPITFTTSTPWSCALPSDPSNPVYLRLGVNGV